MPFARDVTVETSIPRYDEQYGVTAVAPQADTTEGHAARVPGALRKQSRAAIESAERCIMDECEEERSQETDATYRWPWTYICGHRSRRRRGEPAQGCIQQRRRDQRESYMRDAQRTTITDPDRGGWCCGCLKVRALFPLAWRVGGLESWRHRLC